MDPLTIGLTGAAIAGGAFNTAQTGRMNKKSMRFSREMYDKQKTDNLAFWQMQNEYNSPQQQMKRFQEAGLNPNMIYGAGSGGASGTAGSVQTPNIQNPEFKAPQIEGLPQNLMMIYDMDIKQAQSDNIKAQTTATQEETILKMMEQAGKGYDNFSKEIKARMDGELYNVHADLVKERLRQLKISNQYQLDESERAIALFQPKLENALEDILTKRLGREVTSQQLVNLGLDAQVKQLDARLANMGVRPSDPFYAKALATLVGLAVDRLGGIDPDKINPYIQPNKNK
jgi:hypothetical protein